MEIFYGKMIEITKTKDRFCIYCDNRLVKKTRSDIYITLKDNNHKYEYDPRFCYRKSGYYPPETLIDVFGMIIYLYNIPKVYTNSNEIWVMKQ